MLSRIWVALKSKFYDRCFFPTWDYEVVLLKIFQTVSCQISFTYLSEGWLFSKLKNSKLSPVTLEDRQRHSAVARVLVLYQQRYLLAIMSMASSSKGCLRSKVMTGSVPGMRTCQYQSPLNELQRDWYPHRELEPWCFRRESAPQPLHYHHRRLVNKNKK